MILDILDDIFFGDFKEGASKRKKAFEARKGTIRGDVVAALDAAKLDQATTTKIDALINAGKLDEASEMLSTSTGASEKRRASVLAGSTQRIGSKRSSVLGNSATSQSLTSII